MSFVLGYADRRTARPGERVAIMASSDAPLVRAELVRFLDGSPDPPAGMAPAVPLSPPLVAEAPGGVQPAIVGSRADLPWHRDSDDDPLLVRCWFLATAPGRPDRGSRDEPDGSVRPGTIGPQPRRRQVIWAIGSEADEHPSLAAVIEPDGRLSLESAGRSLARAFEPVRPRVWYGLLVAVGGDGVVAALTTRIGRWDTVGHDERLAPRDRIPIARGRSILRLASWRTDGNAETFDGKIASPGISAASPEPDPSVLLTEGVPLPTPVVAQWAPLLEPGTDRIPDVGPAGSHGRTVNMPTRACTGPFWAPRDGGATITPAHDAVHFHADDVGDLGWQETHVLALPSDLPSDVYAIRLEAGVQRMHIPIWIRPASPSAPVAFLAPTNTYLAYANNRLFVGGEAFKQLTATQPGEPSRWDTLVLDHPFLGRSTYDRHDDGSGVCLASWGRPLVSLEPEGTDTMSAAPRHFAVDLYLVGWLRRAGLGFDVLTDEDLHREGVEALRPYRVIVTGSHPEYWSRPMIESLQRYLQTGGKLMYLGGNGFYWMTGLAHDLSYIEVRRGYQGTRAWDSEPGEAVNATSGEPGGLWRILGVPPQSLVGVGMSAQGWGGGRGYRRLEDSFDERVAGFFEGIGADEIIGDFGFVMGGAVGDEVDRMDASLGTPPNALRLATSETLPDQYQLVVEDVRNMVPAFGGTQCELVRADMVWFDLPGGGEVFSVGSISWAGALGWRGGRNNVDRLSTNVLRTFLTRPR